MLYVVKRDGREVEFNADKISQAIKGSANEIGLVLKESEVLDTAKKITDNIELEYKNNITVEEIQNIVEKALQGGGHKDIASAYSAYRKERTKVRKIKSDLMRAIRKIGVETDRDNANVGNNFSSKLLRIASESNKWNNLAIMPKKLSRAHETGDLYYHDLDSYNLTVNCLHIPTKEMLEEGFNTGYGTINAPKRIETAAELSCILLQSTQNDMFGGQSHPDFDNDMAVFIEPTRQEIRKEFEELEIPQDKIEELCNSKEIIRNRLKIKASIENSKIFKSITSEYGSFYSYLCTFSENKIYYEVGKTRNELSDKISNNLIKRGMKFVGTTIIYSYLQAIGIIYSHEKDCYLYKEM